MQVPYLQIRSTLQVPYSTRSSLGAAVLAAVGSWVTSTLTITMIVARPAARWSVGSSYYALRVRRLCEWPVHKKEMDKIS